MSRFTAVDLPSAVTYKALTVDGLSIAYRGAGDPAYSKLVLLHGFPPVVAPVPQPDSIGSPFDFGAMPTPKTDCSSASPGCQSGNFFKFRLDNFDP